MLALLLLACVRPELGPEPLAEDGPVLLGWRFVPGAVLHMRLETALNDGAHDVLRREDWDYLVTEVDDQGGAVLRGHLTGLGARVARGGQPAEGEDFTTARDAEKQRLAELETRLELSLDGRLIAFQGLDGADALPHRLLALQLATEPVTSGARWPDPALARPYAELMPVGLDVTVEAHERLEGLYDRDGAVQARVLTEGGVRSSAEDSPWISLQGEAWWDMRAGQLVERHLEARLEGVSTGEILALQMSVARLP